MTDTSSPYRSCSIDGCGNKHIARGWCKKHYRRWYEEHGRRQIAKRGRILATHCRNGHKYTEDNTRIRKDGRRTCLRCADDREYRTKHRPRDECSVDELEYFRRNRMRREAKMHGALTGPPREGPWTAEEDALVLREDIFLVEKIAMLQRTRHSISRRLTILRSPFRACPICGKAFQQLPSILTCSKACGSVHSRVLFPIPCSGCGEDFKPRTSTQKYCTLQCCTADKATRLHLPCQHCGTSFKQGNPGQRFCSQRCMGIGSRTIQLRPCLHCGIQFKPKEQVQMYCSVPCGRQSPKVKSAKRCRSATAAPLLHRPCEHCGTEFRPKYEAAKYCSMRCSSDSQRKNPNMNCAVCGRGYRRGKPGKYCSRKCYGLSIRKPAAVTS